MKNSAHSFAQVPRADIQRSSFNRSHGVKTTFNSGFLVPIFTDEVLPGDTFNLKTTGFARLSTPLYPVMDTMYLDTFYFAVPLRLLWDNFQKMMGEQDNPDDSTDFTTPVTSAPAITGYLENSLQDYLGLPTKAASMKHTALITRTYNLIYNSWFRDQNLQDSVVVDKDDGPDDPSDYKLLRRGKRHDYFTSALPWPQKGDDVTIPIGTSAPVTGVGTLAQNIINARVDTVNTTFEVQLVGGSDLRVTAAGGNDNDAVDWKVANQNVNAGTFVADLSQATAASINQLRQAFQIQKLFEKDARGGTRYTSIIRSHFGVTSPDSRLQRPEYLGGGSSMINITPIAQTAPDASDGSVGALGAMGTASFHGHGFTKSFTEHCIIIGLANVRADLSYQQGLNRQFARTDRLSYYWPSFAHIGEQEILNGEIDVYHGNPLEVFGYQERYAEYRYKPSTIHGQFRSNCVAPLDAWHLAQEFDSLPILGDLFIQDNPPIDRVVVVQDEPQFICDFHHNLTTARPMPLFGVPGQMDRF